MPRSKRTRLATGIYKDKAGIAAVVTVRGQRREQRFPLNTPLSDIRAEMQRTRVSLHNSAPEHAVKGTLDAVVQSYLSRLPEGGYKTDRATLLTPWVTALGSHRFSAITRPQIVTTLMQWEADGLTAPTRNKRLSALRVLWRTIAPDDLPHACERLKRAPSPRPQRNRARPLALIQFVLEHVAPTNRKAGNADSHAKLQLTLLAWTGQGASTLARIRPEHLRWDTDPPEVYLQPRRKGAGAHGTWLPLLPAAQDAMKAWLKVGHTQPWHAGALRQSWQRAIVHAQTALRKDKRPQEAELLTGMRVYDLRHSLLTAMALASGDVYAVSEYAQHSDIRTTLTYMSGASSARVKAGLAALSQAVPRSGATPTPQTNAAERGQRQLPAGKRVH